MASIPHSSLIHSEIESYLDDAINEISGNKKTLRSSPEFSGIFKNCMSTYLACKRFNEGNTVTLLESAATTIKRCPTLILAGQLQLAYVELRRVIETIIRFVYFYDHPIEWSIYCGSSSNGFSYDDTKPILWCATRPQTWYIDYCKERFATDRSKLVEKAISHFSNTYRHTSRHVHATLAEDTGTPLSNMFDPIDVTSLRSFRETQKRVYLSAAILALAPQPNQLGKLTAIERSWFDWLIGTEPARSIRGGAFLA